MFNSLSRNLKGLGAVSGEMRGLMLLQDIFDEKLVAEELSRNLHCELKSCLMFNPLRKE